MFFSLQQSAFLHSLGSAIGNSLWQLAALWLIFAAISGVTKMNPANRYRLALLFSTAGFLWFIVSLVTNYINTASSPLNNWDFSQSFVNPLVANGFSDNIAFVYHSLVASLTSLSPYISCAYLLVWLLLATRLVNGFRQVKQFGSQGLGKVHIDLKLFVQQHAALLQIQKKVKIFTSAYVQSPLTIGFFKPLILLPVASMAHLSPAQVEAILLHELAHIKRHDYLVNIFVQIAEITLFFNPFMRLLLKQIKQERENCCDDYVLQFQYNAADYAKALLGIAKNRTATLLAMNAKDSTSQFQLLNRIRRIIAPQPQTFNYRQQLYMLCLITILGLGITMIVPNSAAQTKKQANLVKAIARPAEAPALMAEDKEVDINEPPSPPQPVPYDFIKSVAHLTQLAQTNDIEGIEKEGKEIESHSKEIEEQTKQITEAALKNIQPIIENTKIWAENFSKKMESQKMPEDGNLNAYVSSIIETVNESMKDVSKHTVAQPSTAKPENPFAPVINLKAKINKQIIERKILLAHDQLEDQQDDTRKSMDTLQSALTEIRNTKRQEAQNRLLAKLDAIKNNEDWDIGINDNDNIDKVINTNQYTYTYVNKMGVMIKKLIRGFTGDANLKELNNIQIEIKNEMDKIQPDKINIQIMDKHQKNQRKNVDAGNVIIVNDNCQGS